MIRLDGDLICLETDHTGYYMARRGALLETLHYGAKIQPDVPALREKTGAGYGTDVVVPGAEPDSLLHLCLELTPDGRGDFRMGMVSARFADGSTVCDWTFYGAEQREEPLPPAGLPAAWGGAETLVSTFTTTKGLEAQLIYTLYPACDVITRRLRLRNTGDAPVTILRCLSSQLDLPRREYTLTTFTGAWARERRPQAAPLTEGVREFGSRTGNSSHYCNPFFQLAEPGTGEDSGRVYGFNLIYSGSHLERVETGPYGKTRVLSGIQPEHFSWTLAPGEMLDTPEAVLTFSRQGTGGVSRNLHRFVRRHIVRGPWADRPRPVLLNNWEATYFDFNEGKLLRLAREAKKLGIELFVLDDGWFGKRDSDTCSLGDYTVNSKKLPGGLAGLGRKLNDLGLAFGLWVEPEMVSPDSELYRSHPDWAVQTPGISPALSRHQLVLDLCRPEVQDYLIGQLNALLDSVPIRYIKWDMNRHMTDCYSPVLAEQGRFSLCWMQGLYRVLEQVTGSHPEVLFESCASGGNRFDLGMLCYMPQIWTSDDTDAWERMKIQSGTSGGYPQSVMGCHVAASPNHQTLRTSQLEARFDVAAFGILGYELDVTRLSPAEKSVVAAQIAFYKQHRKLFQFGQLYRLASPFVPATGGEQCAWMVVSDDKTEALVLDAVGRIEPNSETPPLRLAGLDPNRRYRVESRAQKIDIRDFGTLLNAVLPVSVNTSGLLVHAAADRYMLDTEKESYTAAGDLLMEAGLRRKARFAGTGYNEEVRVMPDYSARLYYLTALPDALPAPEPGRP